MDHTPVTNWINEAASAAEKQGSGDLLRVVLIVMFFGCILTAWLLLRGYRQKDD
ncbi:hypothetical protein [Streptomyces graminilatus]|uniref:hypothetical protein n=1 Tax=Streptomyces graminilatus TaxID=1464070 RepID=UPI000AB73F07|nr:hypothetical protein [Streptomyces graminilatus]